MKGREGTGEGNPTILPSATLITVDPTIDVARFIAQPLPAPGTHTESDWGGLGPAQSNNRPTGKPDPIQRSSTDTNSTARIYDSKHAADLRFRRPSSPPPIPPRVRHPRQAPSPRREEIQVRPDHLSLYTTLLVPKPPRATHSDTWLESPALPTLPLPRAVAVPLFPWIPLAWARQEQDHGHDASSLQGRPGGCVRIPEYHWCNR